MSASPAADAEQASAATAQEDSQDPADEARRLFTLGEAGSTWFVFHARPRCEKKAAQACRDLQVHHYLPLLQKRNRHRPNHHFDVPLFPGYLFGRCDKDERVALLRTGYLVRTIDVVDQQKLLEELHNVYLASNGQADLHLFPQLKRGRLVRVLRGPLAGVTGRVSKRKEALRLVLNVSILGTAVAAEMEMDDVELIYPG